MLSSAVGVTAQESAAHTRMKESRDHMFVLCAAILSLPAIAPAMGVQAKQPFERSVEASAPVSTSVSVQPELRPVSAGQGSSLVNAKPLDLPRPAAVPASGYMQLVPTPGAAVLLGLGGIALIRRKREGR